MGKRREEGTGGKAGQGRHRAEAGVEIHAKGKKEMKGENVEKGQRHAFEIWKFL